MIDIRDEAGAPTSLRRAEGERKLLRAILMDGVRCLLGDVGGSPATRAQLASEARAWIDNRGRAQPFSFENVCAWLEVPAERLRRCLFEQLANRDSSAPVVGPDGASRHPVALEERLRDERNARIQDLRAAGARPREIATRFGLTYGSVLFICAGDHPEA